MITLILDGIELELTNDSYKESFKNVDSLSTSEAGTTLRSVTRTGIRGLNVSYECIESEKVKLDALSKQSSLCAQIFDETEEDIIDWRCFMSGYSADLEVDGNNRFYKVSFNLNDLES